MLTGLFQKRVPLARDPAEVMEARIDQLSREVLALRETLPERASIPHPLLAPDRFVAALSFGAGDDVLGSNWYDPEYSGDRVWRWSGPGRLSSFSLMLDRRVALRLRLENLVFAPGVIPVLTLFLDGISHGRKRVAGSSVSFDLPAKSANTGMTEIGLLTGNTEQPRNANGVRMDNRWLGFQFGAVSVTVIQ